ncbi:hypothetical protein SRHO_G00293820 [Serrasalmus rhombeus]
MVAPGVVQFTPTSRMKVKVGETPDLRLTLLKPTVRNITTRLASEIGIFIRDIFLSTSESCMFGHGIVEEKLPWKGKKHRSKESVWLSELAAGSEATRTRLAKMPEVAWGVNHHHLLDITWPVQLNPGSGAWNLKAVCQSWLSAMGITRPMLQLLAHLLAGWGLRCLGLANLL